MIDKYKIQLAPHYKTGACRLGCVGCPLVTRKGARKFEFDLYPKYYEAIKKAIAGGMNNNPQWKLTYATDRDAELAMQWWLSGKTMDEYFPYRFEKNGSGLTKKNIQMKKLAEKGGLLWVVLAIIPTAEFTNIIGKAIHLDSSIIVAIQLPAIALQLFSLFILIRYCREFF